MGLCTANQCIIKLDRIKQNFLPVSQNKDQSKQRVCKTFNSVRSEAETVNKITNYIFSLESFELILPNILVEDTFASKMLRINKRQL